MIDDFRRHLPCAEIVVCDNASTDDTASIARKAGARIIFEVTPGKANAMARLFYEVDADIYVMADADGTYDASVAQACVLEMVTEYRHAYSVKKRAGRGKCFSTNASTGQLDFHYPFQVIVRLKVGGCSFRI